MNRIAFADLAFLVLAAVAVAVLVVREIRNPPRLAVSSPVQQVSREPAWPELASSARVVRGTSDGAFIIQIGDFQCPYCRQFMETVDAIAQVRNGAAKVGIVHFPLPQHRGARRAAVFFECAARLEFGSQMHDALFARQEGLDTLTVAGAAALLPVAVRAAFSSCCTSQAASNVVSRDSARAVDIGIRGTPTVLIEGWRFSIPPTAKDLQLVLDALSKGIDPRSAF